MEKGCPTYESACEEGVTPKRGPSCCQPTEGVSRLTDTYPAVNPQVKSARKAYAIKHGLPLDLDAMEGFVDERVEAAAEAAAANAEAGGAEAGGSETGGGDLDDGVARESDNPDEPPSAVEA
jgi:hypothetical protein